MTNDKIMKSVTLEKMCDIMSSVIDKYPTKVPEIFHWADIGEDNRAYTVEYRDTVEKGIVSRIINRTRIWDQFNILYKSIDKGNKPGYDCTFDVATSEFKFIATRVLPPYTAKELLCTAYDNVSRDSTGELFIGFLSVTENNNECTDIDIVSLGRGGMDIRCVIETDPLQNRILDCEYAFTQKTLNRGELMGTIVWLIHSPASPLPKIDHPDFCDIVVSPQTFGKYTIVDICKIMSMAFSEEYSIASHVYPRIPVQNGPSKSVYVRSSFGSIFELVGEIVSDSYYPNWIGLLSVIPENYYNTPLAILDIDTGCHSIQFISYELGTEISIRQRIINQYKKVTSGRGKLYIGLIDNYVKTVSIQLVGSNPRFDIERLTDYDSMFGRMIKGYRFMFTQRMTSNIEFYDPITRITHNAVSAEEILWFIR